MNVYALDIEMKKTTWVFVFQKYGIFWCVSLDHFIENNKLLFSEECMIINISTIKALNVDLYWCDGGIPLKDFYSNSFHLENVIKKQCQ